MSEYGPAIPESGGIVKYISGRDLGDEQPEHETKPDADAGTRKPDPRYVGIESCFANKRRVGYGR